MVAPQSVAKYFIIRAYEEHLDTLMTNMKLQKLLYYSQCLYLALFDEPLFTEEIQAWRWGPVCPPAYFYYSEFEAQQLPLPEPEILPSNVQDVLEEVWQCHKNDHAFKLSDLTHSEFPWLNARKGLADYERSTKAILWEDMRLLGERKLTQIEKSHPEYEKTIVDALTEFQESKTHHYLKQEEVNDWLTSLLD